MPSKVLTRPQERALQSELRAAPPAGREQTPSDGSDFTQRVSPHLPFLIRVAREILGSEDLAWDAVQETLMRLWARGYLPEDARRPLAHLVRKSSLHLLRCQRRRSFHEQGGEGASEHASHHGEICCEDDPLALIDEAERAAIVREEIAGIARRYRAVLELHALEGQSYEDIAVRLNVPVGTVRSRLNRGRSLLRERLSARISAA